MHKSMGCKQCFIVINVSVKCYILAEANMLAATKTLILFQRIITKKTKSNILILYIVLKKVMVNPYSSNKPYVLATVPNH